MFGILPSHIYHLLALVVPLLLWLLTRSSAKRQHLTIMHNSALAVAYWEEVLFRGLVFGLLLGISDSFLLATVVSSLLFGLFHLRNLWWATRKQVLMNCLYTGIIVGPILCGLRWWSGDMYIGIAAHALHNVVSMQLSGNGTKPSDEYLFAQRNKMNWFEYAFSGFWLLR